MTWAGICLGIIIGLMSGSFSGFIACLAIGWLLGYLFRRLLSAADLTGENAYIPDTSNSMPQEDPAAAQKRLENKILLLQQQMNELAKRLAALEQHHAPANNSATPLHNSTITPPPVTAQEYHPPLNNTAPITYPDPPTTQEHATPPPVRTTQTTASPTHTPLYSESYQPKITPSTPSSSPEKPSETDTTDTASLSAQSSISGTRLYTTQNDDTIHRVQRKPLPPREPQEPTWLETAWQRWIIGGNPMVKIGVLILFLGLAFLLRYAAEHAVLPIELRYAGVAASGIGLLIFGWRWRTREDNYGLILQGAGIGVLYLTTLAAMKLHPLIPHEFGFVILIGVAGYAALLAILQNALALAIAGTLGGFAAPLLASNGGGHHVAFFSYLTILNLGIVAIAWFKAWRPLNAIGFVCSFALGSAWASEHYDTTLFSTTEPFVLLLFVFYVVITFLFARRKLDDAPEGNGTSLESHLLHSASHIDYVDGFLAFGVPFATFGWQYLLVKSTEYGAAFSALGFGLIYILLAFVLFNRGGKRYALLTETLIALSVVFGSLAIPLGLEHTSTSAAWAIEAAGMYWIGIRQLRVHARLFALILFMGSAFYFALGIHFGGSDSVLEGSWLDCFILAASASAIFWQMRQTSPDDLHDFEKDMRPHVIRISAFFIGLLPFLLWNMDWAAPALALLGTLAVYAAFRLPAHPLLSWGVVYQALAGILFLGTLHSADHGSVLTRGWIGLLEVSIIGLSLLGSVYVWIRQQIEGTTRTDENITLSGAATAGVLAGLIFINIAPLFVLPLRFAAMIWPLIGIATLWWAIRAQHFGILLFALALQGISGLSYISTKVSSATYGGTDTEALTPFLHSGFWGPLLISLAAFACARILQRTRREDIRTLGWTALGWFGLWWAFAWSTEILRAAPSDMITIGLIGITLSSAGLWSYFAQRWTWPQLGSATLAYLPVLILIGLSSHDAHPLAGWNILAWPAALVMHTVLLRWQSHWVSRTLQGFTHIIGVWLFIILSAIELRWHFAQWGDPGSAWPLLGWIIAPMAYLWTISRPSIQTKWPIHDFREDYLTLSAVPIAIYVLAWTWLSNWISDGTASPLPYIPLFNPLEMAHCAALLGIALWHTSRHQDEDRQALASPMAIGIGGITSLALITGIVMRTCHHWGDVPWNTSALFASTLVQTSLSIVWSIVAIGLMVSVKHNKRRWVWMSGATLMAIVVIKLFLIELAAHGSLARIVSFIVVGMLLLLVGYFAPLPPKD